MTLLLLGQEKKTFKVCPFFLLGPPWPLLKPFHILPGSKGPILGLAMNKLQSSCKNIPICNMYCQYCFYFVWKRRFYKFDPLSIRGPPLPPRRVTCAIPITLDPYPPRMVPTKFGQNLLTGSGEGNKNKKHLQILSNYRFKK